MPAREKVSLPAEPPLRPLHAHRHSSTSAPVPVAYTRVLELAGRVPESEETKIRFTRKVLGPDVPAIDFVLVTLQQTISVAPPNKPGPLILACRRLADWADRCREPGTALGYVQAAIRIHQESPMYRAGRAAVQQGRRAQAIQLFELAVHYATEARDWEQAAKSYTQLGRAYVMAKDFASAEKAHASALRVARAHGLKRQGAQALHNLATVALDQQDGNTAFVYARLALQAYGRDYESLSLLANDVAYFWMVSEGAYKIALEMFEASLPYAAKEIDRFDILANIARAAAGCDNLLKFDDAVAGVEALAGMIPYQERVAGGLLELAEGFHILRRYEEAEGMVARARELAAERVESKYVSHADELRKKIRERRHESLAPRSRIEQIRNHGLAERLISLRRHGARQA
jgi:tetratricopeptide (TPR) repeat protein